MYVTLKRRVMTIIGKAQHFIEQTPSTLRRNICCRRNRRKKQKSMELGSTAHTTKANPIVVVPNKCLRCASEMKDVQYVVNVVQRNITVFLRGRKRKREEIGN